MNWAPASAVVGHHLAVFEKRRTPAALGSIPAILGMFEAEVRFYREVAVVPGGLGVRVPSCSVASIDGVTGATHLVLESLGPPAWTPGGDPVVVAAALGGLHRRWAGRAASTWPWLREVGRAASEIGALYDSVWPEVAARGDVPSVVRSLGASLVGGVAAAERAEGGAVDEVGPLTLCHGDASLRNVFSSPSGREVVFVDWEDVRCAPGVTDLAWLLVSSVAPSAWDAVVAAYGPVPPGALERVLPSAVAQGILSSASSAVGSAEASAWFERLGEAARRLGSS
jgi:hypothetical protein